MHHNWLELSTLKKIVESALAEDIGAGDITTSLTVAADAVANGEIVAREAGVLAGMPIVEMAFALTDSSILLSPKMADGAAFLACDVLAEVGGPARGILTAERVALNFLQRLSGIATRTAGLVRLVEGKRARIVDTRKTAPGLRVLEKYAVRAGGGHNHRFGLDDGILIKDNHIIAAGGVAAAVSAAKAGAPHTLRVEVEVQDLYQLDEALRAGADAVLLDNMDLGAIREAVSRCAGRAIVEVSGGVTEENVRQIAETGVDIISVGALTHSVTAMDIALDLVPACGM